MVGIKNVFNVAKVALQCLPALKICACQYTLVWNVMTSLRSLAGPWFALRKLLMYRTFPIPFMPMRPSKQTPYIYDSVSRCRPLKMPDCTQSTSL